MMIILIGQLKSYRWPHPYHGSSKVNLTFTFSAKLPFFRPFEAKS